MANTCFNTVRFSGGPTQLEKIKTLFLEMEAKGDLEGKGQLPPFIDTDEGYFFEIDYYEDTLFYTTKWVPNTDVILNIAKQFEVDFVDNFEELGNGIYGETQCKDGQLTVIDLDSEDFALYEYDEHTQTYQFEGENFDGDPEILAILLKRKKLKSL